jgi:hypothetical protein
VTADGNAGDGDVGVEMTGTPAHPASPTGSGSNAGSSGGGASSGCSSGSTTQAIEDASSDDEPERMDPEPPPEAKDSTSKRKKRKKGKKGQKGKKSKKPKSSDDSVADKVVERLGARSVGGVAGVSSRTCTSAYSVATTRTPARGRPSRRGS